MPMPPSSVRFGSDYWFKTPISSAQAKEALGVSKFSPYLSELEMADKDGKHIEAEGNAKKGYTRLTFPDSLDSGLDTFIAQHPEFEVTKNSVPEGIFKDFSTQILALPANALYQTASHIQTRIRDFMPNWEPTFGEVVPLFKSLYPKDTNFKTDPAYESRLRKLLEGFGLDRGEITLACLVLFNN